MDVSAVSLPSVDVSVARDDVSVALLTDVEAVGAISGVPVVCSRIVPVIPPKDVDSGVDSPVSGTSLDITSAVVADTSEIAELVSPDVSDDGEPVDPVVEAAIVPEVNDDRISSKVTEPPLVNVADSLVNPNTENVDAVVLLDSVAVTVSKNVALESVSSNCVD